MPEPASTDSEKTHGRFDAGMVAFDVSVVLVHASAAGPQSLTHFANRLASPVRSVNVPALAGYGGSSVAPEDDPLTQHRLIVRQALRQHSARHRILFGHSMGGLIALLTALDCARLNEPLDGLILFDPILVDLLDQAIPVHQTELGWDRDIIARLGASVEAGDPCSGVSAFVEAWNEVEWDRLPGNVRQELINRATQLVCEATATSFQKLDRSGIRNLPTPVLILHGARSPRLINLTNDALACLLPSADCLRIEGVGHMAPVLTPDSIVGHVAAFIEKACSRDSEGL